MFEEFKDKQFKVVYADPAWEYKDKANAGKRGAAHKYKVTGFPELVMLPVPEIAAPDSVLFMWTTMPMLPTALDLMKAWGFTYKTVAFTWVKPAYNGGWRWGMGSWTRANPELCLLGVRGKPKRVSAGVHSVISAVPTKHSAKPQEARDRIVQLMGDVPRVELFARGNYPGWDVWGDEVPNV